MSDDKNIRHRFTVPVGDSVVNKWIEEQSNLGFSLRVLIKAFVRSYGYQDATCLEFGTPVKKRGRPPKQVNIKYAVMDNQDMELQFDPDSDYDETEEETAYAEIETDTVEEKAVAKKQQTAAPEAPTDVMSALRDRGSVSVPIGNSAGNVSSDDDGFVDPDSLL